MEAAAMALGCLCPFTCLHPFLSPSSRQSVKAVLSRFHSCLCILLSSSLLKKTLLVFLSDGWKAGLEMLSAEDCLCVVDVCLVLITFWRRLSEGKNHLSLDDGFCHVLLLF